MWNKSTKLNGVGYDIRGIVLEEAERLEREGVDVLKLNIGNTAPFSLFASPMLLESVVKHLDESQGYGDSKGNLFAREAISEYYRNRDIQLDVDNIFMGNGVSELIGLCMNAFLDQGDEILLPSPDYPLWTASVTLCGGNPVHYICDEDNQWFPDIDDIRRKITKKTKAIVVINPNNPTGAVYSKEILQEIVNLAEAYNLLIFSDEIYERVLYDGAQMHYMASVCGDHPCVFFNGLSKSYRAPGLRVGWIGIHDPHKKIDGYKEGINMLSNMRLCSNMPSQWATVAALKYDNEIENLVAEGGRLHTQRQIVMDTLSQIEGVSTQKPMGAMYVFPRFDKKAFNLLSDEKMVLDLLYDKHVLLVHGAAFNYFQNYHVRIVFLPEEDRLKKAMLGMQEFFRNYKQEL